VQAKVPLFVVAGGLPSPMLVFTLFELTARAQAEEELRAKLERLRHVPRRTESARG
jgi:hypothetical protein